MIVARKINYDKEADLVNNILEEEGIQDSRSENEIKFVLEENSQIIGTSKVKIYKDIGVLKYLIIAKEHRGNDLGDGLLRSILNSCDLAGIKEVYYTMRCNYLIKKGFKTIDRDNLPEVVKEITKENTALVINLSQFFNQCCTKHARS
jgi:N-acetylglutamate synthase-like GNAT family acetyltransferase